MDRKWRIEDFCTAFYSNNLFLIKAYFSGFKPQILDSISPELVSFTSLSASIEVPYTFSFFNQQISDIAANMFSEGETPTFYHIICFLHFVRIHWQYSLFGENDDSLLIKVVTDVLLSNSLFNPVRKHGKITHFFLYWLGAI